MSVTSKPKLIIFAGPNGSGKTTLYYEWLFSGKYTKFEYINTDEYTAELGSEIAGARKTLTRRQQLLASKTSFVTETTLAGRSGLQLLTKALTSGFSSKRPVDTPCSESG